MESPSHFQQKSGCQLSVSHRRRHWGGSVNNTHRESYLEDLLDPRKTVCFCTHLPLTNRECLSFACHWGRHWIHTYVTKLWYVSQNDGESLPPWGRSSEVGRRIGTMLGRLPWGLSHEVGERSRQRQRRWGAT